MPTRRAPAKTDRPAPTPPPAPAPGPGDEDPTPGQKKGLASISLGTWLLLAAALGGTWMLLRNNSGNAAGSVLVSGPAGSASSGDSTGLSGALPTPGPTTTTSSPAPTPAPTAPQVQPEDAQINAWFQQYLGRPYQGGSVGTGSDLYEQIYTSASAAEGGSGRTAAGPQAVLYDIANSPEAIQRRQTGLPSGPPVAA